ncbi:MAG: BrnT family toxin [Defluviitaleaceae bacterium]|nr:BrnT family toxin [Defluviitaleaceae bacterium]
MGTETYELRGQKFNWDRNKNLSNIEKHGISFKSAALTFFDPNAATLEDTAHLQDEERFLLIGLSEAHRLLTVCHCFREDDTVIRIISARKATKQEEKEYGGVS